MAIWFSVAVAPWFAQDVCFKCSSILIVWLWVLLCFGHYVCIVVEVDCEKNTPDSAFAVFCFGTCSGKVF